MIRNACKPVVAAPARTTAGLSLSLRPQGPEFLGNSEPDLGELMADEVVRRLMARDGVEPEEILSLAAYVPAR